MVLPRPVAFAPARIGLAALLLVPLLATTAAALAQGSAPSAGPPAADRAWRTVVDPEAGFALRLPPSHDLARSGGVWYVHGWLDGMTLVPDATINLLPGVAPDEVVATFPADAEAVPVDFGPATRGLRVTARYEAMDGTPYDATSYLVEGPEGTFRIDRYEGFDWEPFEAVARSFALVELVGPVPGAP